MTSWAGRLRQALQAFNYSDDYSDDDASMISYTIHHDGNTALQAALRESFEEAHICHEEEVVMGVSIASNPNPKLTLIECGDKCSLCWDEIEVGTMCFRTPCNHIYCSKCIKNPLLNKCGRCNQTFCTAEPVKAIKVKVEDDH
jgi:hypothetical protein